MTLVLKSVRKVAVLGWSKAEPDDTREWALKGETVSLEVTHHDGTKQEVRDVKNDGEADLFFPLDYSGSTTVTATGSAGGTETATISVS